MAGPCTAFHYMLMIVAVLAIGVIVALFQVARLRREIGWLQAFSRNEEHPPPRLLAPLARQLVALDRNTVQLTPTAARAILDDARGEAGPIKRGLALGGAIGLATLLPQVQRWLNRKADPELRAARR